MNEDEHGDFIDPETLMRITDTDEFPSWSSMIVSGGTRLTPKRMMWKQDAPKKICEYQRSELVAVHPLMNLSGELVFTQITVKLLTVVGGLVASIGAPLDLRM